MEKLLITLTIRTRVEPDPNELVRALERSTNMRGRLWVLGTTGKTRRVLQGQYVAAFGTSDRFMKFAQAGLLYYEAEPEVAEKWAFSPGADAGTQLPLLLEPYEVAFRKRSYLGEGEAVDAEKQATLELKATQP